jgi:hypothetical protein
VPHIKRFNLTTDDANAILRSADEHLSAMGVPYALALHEDHMKSCIQLLEQVSLVGRGTADDSKLATQHDIIANATNGIFSSIARKQMNTLRHMGNCGIHSGGRASAALVTDVASWPPEVEAAWIKVAGRSLRGIARNDRVTFAYGEMILALAVAKTLDREANVMLQASLPRQSWSDMVVAELVSQQPAVIRSSVALRKANGIARQFYSPLKLTESELADAIARAR